VVAKLRYQYLQAHDLLAKRKEDRIKRAEAENDPERKRALELREYMSLTKVHEAGSLEAMTDAELEARVQEMFKWKDLEARQLTANEEIVFCYQHYCNDNLKKRPSEKKI
jgi:hypothetical protein